MHLQGKSSAVNAQLFDYMINYKPKDYIILCDFRLAGLGFDIHNMRSVGAQW